ncbi:MAG: hypothetical protein M5U34_34325 [Chloroflexi bacterium]|nr:hypothetical protein [Chloroflexota bacterium]
MPIAARAISNGAKWYTVPGWGQYRTPIAGLYLNGAGAHPGGGVTGEPGRLAAQAILQEMG